MGFLQRLFGGAAPSAAPPAAVPAAPVRPWVDLPPLQATFRPTELTLRPATFESNLTTRQRPALIGPMAHDVAAEAPGGHVTAPAAEVPRQQKVTFPVPPRLPRVSRLTEADAAEEVAPIGIDSPPAPVFVAEPAMPESGPALRLPVVGEAPSAPEPAPVVSGTATELPAPVSPPSRDVSGPLTADPPAVGSGASPVRRAPAVPGLQRAVAEPPAAPTVGRVAHATDPPAGRSPAVTPAPSPTLRPDRPGGVRSGQPVRAARSHVPEAPAVGEHDAVAAPRRLQPYRLGEPEAQSQGEAPLPVRVARRPVAGDPPPSPGPPATLPLGAAPSFAPTVGGAPASPPAARSLPAAVGRSAAPPGQPLAPGPRSAGGPAVAPTSVTGADPRPCRSGHGRRPSACGHPTGGDAADGAPNARPLSQ